MSDNNPLGFNDDLAQNAAVPGVQAFHLALNAALHSKVALDLGRGAKPKSGRGGVPSGRLTYGKLQSLQTLAQTPLPDRAAQPTDPTEVLASAFGERAVELPEKYVSGFSVYLLTGRTDLVLDAMSVDRRANRELARVARPSLAYLAILVLVGALGSGVLAFALLWLDRLRNDLLLVPHSLAVSTELRPWITESQLFILPWIALLILVIVCACLLTPVSAGIAKLLGGFGYVNSQRRTMAARVEHALVMSGVGGAAAEQTATKLVGSHLSRKRVLRTVTRGDQSLSDLQRLGLEAKHYHARSNARLRQLRFGLPLLLVMTFGSAGVLLYSLALFVPLTNLLYELSAPTVDPVMKWDN